MAETVIWNSIDDAMTNFTLVSRSRKPCGTAPNTTSIVRATYAFEDKLHCKGACVHLLRAFPLCLGVLCVAHGLDRLVVHVEAEGYALVELKMKMSKSASTTNEITM